MCISADCVLHHLFFSLPFGVSFTVFVIRILKPPSLGVEAEHLAIEGIQVWDDYKKV